MEVSHGFLHLSAPAEPFRKPSRNEEEFFLREEFAERKALARRRAEIRRAAEKTRLRELHWNRCPRCGESLQHVRIRRAWADQCPVCQGVWLDREVFCLLTGERERPLAALFRYLLMEQCMGQMRTD